MRRSVVQRALVAVEEIEFLRMLRIEREHVPSTRARENLEPPVTWTRLEQVRTGGSPIVSPRPHDDHPRDRHRCGHRSPRSRRLTAPRDPMTK
jgi:hypothetical protein